MATKTATILKNSESLSKHRKRPPEETQRGGLFWEARSGLPRGSSLSPVLGAFFLAEVDAALTHHGVWFVRYMDDILVLTPTRWSLRRAVRLVHATLRNLGLEIQPTKTFIGRIEKGFDFLGFRFSPHGVTVAAATWERFVGHALQLYEHDRRETDDSPRLEAYVRRWSGWASATTGASDGRHSPPRVLS